MNLRSWHNEHGRHWLPWRVEATPWKVLLAEVLLHRTRASAVERVYGKILKKFPAPDAIVQEPRAWLESIQSVGLKWRGKAFILACDALVQDYGNEVPRSRAALVSLSGIGHYIASSVRCFGYGLLEAIVDTNTIRLAHRISGEPLSPSAHRSRKVGEAVARLFENGVAGCNRDNYALLDLAAMVCHTARPQCVKCPLTTACVAGRTTISGSAQTGEDLWPRQRKD